MSVRGEPGRRAPRLGPHEYLAPYVTRRGRFRKLDPLRGRPRPSVPRILGVLGWAALVGGTLAKAIRGRPRPDPGGQV